MTREASDSTRLIAAAAAATVLVSAFVAVALAQPAASPLPRGARIDRSSFEHQRRIPPGPPGVASLRLDLPVLAHSRLADVRLITGGGFQVPYLLQDDPMPLRIELPPLVVVDEREVADGVSQRRGRERTVHAITFPLAGMPPCDLILETNSRVFEREVTVVVKEDDPRRRDAGRWQTRAWGSWRHADPDTPATPLILRLPTVGATTGRVVVDEGDNQPLPIERPRLELRTYRLRFVRETQDEVWLVYGRAGLSAPRYDLALLESRFSRAEASEVAAEPEQRTDQGVTAWPSKILFWGILAAASVALLALVARLIRTPPDASPPTPT
jgi:hypothetical protein